MTTLLLIANIVAFGVQLFLPYQLILNYLSLSLEGMRHGFVFQLLTFQFLHGGLLHILGNCLGIFFFGPMVEERVGSKYFLILYFLGGVLGGLLQLGFAAAFPGWFGGPVMGASAGVFALIAAFAMQNPHETVYLFFMPLPAKFVLVIQGIAALVGIAFHERGIAHAAHLGGMLTGIGFVRWLSREYHPVVMWRPFRRSQRRREYATTSKPTKSNWTPKVVPKESPQVNVMEEVDAILDKIHAKGIQSLTDREKEILETARRKMAKR